MTRRHWIISIVAIILVIVATPVALRSAPHFWPQPQLANLLNGPPPSYEVLPTDNPLTALRKRARQAERARD
jgi:hypothetical protein